MNFITKLAHRLMLVAAGVLMFAGVPNIEVPGNDMINLRVGQDLHAWETDFVLPSMNENENHTQAIGLVALGIIIGIIAAIVGIIWIGIQIFNLIYNWVKTWDDGADWKRWAREITAESKECKKLGGKLDFDRSSPRLSFCKDEDGVILKTWSHDYFE
ncbi:MAG: hypothetical protein OXG88_09850 [Gammaproteobacteria bacterium]|nr:hypothetical protein [Gammaproteobacteria bacterium]